MARFQRDSRSASLNTRYTVLSPTHAWPTVLRTGWALARPASSWVLGDAKLSFERRLDIFTYYMMAGPKGQWGERATFDYDAEEGLGLIARPTLFMAFDDELTEPTGAARSLVRDAEYMHLPGLSRLGFMTHPEKVAHSIRKFLDRSS